jgi:hypothetical protein
MSPIILTLILSLSGLFAPVAGNNTVVTEPKWRQIVLMRSTRDYVERLLGRSQYRGYSASYRVEDGMLFVQYYPFNFCAYPGADLRVRRWTVVEITHEPDNPPKLADLNLDLKKFRKVRESPDAPDLISYVNDEDGVDHTFQDDELIDVRYFPARRYDALRCKKATANRRKI